MTENNMTAIVPVDSTNNALKEALCVQQRLLQKLYNELDVERESAATAASEAMSMILRLQGEKAAVKMEAEQYKRLAEEKMNHAEESMEVFEEIMYQKEMEIASLDYQVQAYRYKLLSLGFDDLGVNELKFPENLLQRSDTLVGESSSDNITNITKKTSRLKLPNMKKGVLERDRMISLDSDMIAKLVEESAREDDDNNNNNSQNFYFDKKADGSSSVDINSYLEQIRKLDKLVEEITGEQYVSSTARTSRCSSVPSKLNELDLARSPQKSIDDKISSDTCSSSVHDVFEVPQVDEQVKDEGKGVFKDDEKLKKLVNFPPESVKSYKKDEIFSGKKTLLLVKKDKNVLLPRDGVTVDCGLALARPAKEGALAEPVNMKTGLGAGDGEGESETESNGQDVRRELINSRDEQELRLLYEIREKIDSIRSEIRSVKITKIEKPIVNCDVPLLQLREAMLDFWF